MNSFYKIEVIDGEGKHINWIDKSFECVDDASDYINKNMHEYLWINGYETEIYNMTVNDWEHEVVF